tara:strand:+ start:344 stop:739 length:396 start_codon:yes stop_codon:yes gene_type:complete
MANTLKVITANSSHSDSSGTTSPNTAGVNDTLYTVPGSVSAAIIVGFHVCNVTTNTIKISVTIESDTTSATVFGNGANKNAFLVKDVPIPEGSTIELLSGNKIFLEDTDKILIQSDTVGGYNCILSFVEQS